MKKYTLEEIMDAFEECAKQRQELEHENKKLKKRNQELEDGFKASIEELSEYATKIDKAIEYINKNILVGFNEVGFKSDIVAGIVVNDLLEILGDKENE